MHVGAPSRRFLWPWLALAGLTLVGCGDDTNITGFGRAPEPLT